MELDAMAARHLDAMASGGVGNAALWLHDENVNHMAADEPPACSATGLAGFAATSAWLRSAFSQLAFEIIEVVSDDTRTMAHVWLRGVQTGPFVVFPVGGKPVSFPPTGRSFAVRQSHVFRLRDGLHAEHIAVRDDLGMMTQLGHLPPGPAAMARLARWNLTGRAKRSIDDVVALTESAAAGVATTVRNPDEGAPDQRAS